MVRKGQLRVVGSQTRITISKLNFPLDSSATKTTTQPVTYTGACNQFLINLPGKNILEVGEEGKAKMCICTEGDKWAWWLHFKSIF